VSFHIRRLPHLYFRSHPIFVTWRLYGSLPKGRVFPRELTSGEVFVAVDRLLDNARTGPMYLSRPEIAGLMVDAIYNVQDRLRLYELHAYVVMANHVHLLITPSVALPKITQCLKRFTAQKANAMLGLTGHCFWQDESYDRLVRNDFEFRRIEKYIEMNPVKAGLVRAPEEFRWSSAWKQKAD
jgi:REP element-mobilizing transposase RayT